MRDSPGCEEIGALLPELALGTAAGEVRGRALAHLASCAGCRRRLEGLTEVADGLLLLGPSAEPRAGFEGRVLERLRMRAGRPSRWRRRAALAAAAALAAILAGAGVWLSSGDVREDAEHYRRALAAADGSYFGALSLRDAAGRSVGHVFGYSGEAPWVFIFVRGADGSGEYAVQAVTRGGERLALGSFAADDGSGSLGATLPVDLRDVARILVIEGEGDEILQAVLPASSD